MNRLNTIRCIAFIALAAAMPVCATGCFTRTIYVPAGKAVRLRQSVKAKVWVLDANGKSVTGEMMLPEGWWALARPE
jgi:hypothetical protein